VESRVIDSEKVETNQYSTKEKKRITPSIIFINYQSIVPTLVEFSVAFGWFASCAEMPKELRYLVLSHLIVNIPRPGDSEESVWSSSQAATCYYQSNHSKFEAIPLSLNCTRTQQAKLQAFSPHYPSNLFNAER